jgi:pilus assembly protein Flp/PilA
MEGKARLAGIRPTASCFSKTPGRGADKTSDMPCINTLLRSLWRNRGGQDLIEYALMAGFVAVAAGAIMPGAANSISSIFSMVGSVMKSSGG